MRTPYPSWCQMDLLSRPITDPDVFLLKNGFLRLPSIMKMSFLTVRKRGKSLFFIFLKLE